MASTFENVVAGDRPRGNQPLPGELIRYDGEIDTRAGWRFLDSNAGEKVYVPFEGFYESKGGRLQSPVIALDKEPGRHACYAWDFTAHTDGHCYWWVDLFDAQDNPLPDINSEVYREPGQTRYRQMIYATGLARHIQLAFQFTTGMSVRDIVVKRVCDETAARWCDQTYAQLPPLKFEPPADAFTRLPTTAQALHRGRPWRIVMLGDSIMNDSFNSVFQALVSRDFPKADLDFLISVRGTTGCWYYQDPEQFQAYVARHQPDLLVIGGISNIEDEYDESKIAQAIDAIARVTEQAKSLGCEVLVLSPPHSIDWRPFDPANPSADLPPVGWNESIPLPNTKRRLFWTPYRDVARRCNVAFWNMTVPTAEYVAQSGKPHNYFNRDFIHNNDRGKQLIGRVLQRYFLTAQNI